MKRLGSLIYIIVCTATAMIGYSIHNSVFWAIMDFIFVPFAWIKWLICHEVCFSVIRHAFEFLTK